MMEQRQRGGMKGTHLEGENLDQVMAAISVTADQPFPNRSPLKQQPANREQSEEEISRRRARVEFLKFKAEQKGMIINRDHISRKIEGMHREYNFIEKLTTDDISYIMDQKKQQAAITLQRQFKSLMERRRKWKKAAVAEEIESELDIMTPG